MDARDLQLIREMRRLGRRGRFTLTELGKKLGISHVAVGKRISKLVSSGLLRFSPEVNIERQGYKVVLVLVEVPGSDELERLEEVYLECPRVVYMVEAVGGYNLAVLMYAETQGVLESILTTCSVRTRPEVRRSEVLVGRLVEEFAPIEPPAGGDRGEAPCGANCPSCRRYLEGRCPGCPATSHYKFQNETIMVSDGYI